jgi:hypothetical protein
MVAKAYQKAKAGGKTHAVTPQERDQQLWLMHEQRGCRWDLDRDISRPTDRLRRRDGAQALLVGGSLQYRTYKPRGG